MTKLIYIISAVLLLGFVSGVNADWCSDDIRECKRKAEQGNASAQNNLGVLYVKGEGVLQDYKKGVYWYSKAAEQGHTKAQFNLGNRYRKGEGVLQDYVMAHMFFNIAGANGDKDGSKYRDNVAKEMNSSQIQEAQRLAREWMQKHP